MKTSGKIALRQLLVFLSKTVLISVLVIQLKKKHRTKKKCIIGMEMTLAIMKTSWKY